MSSRSKFSADVVRKTSRGPAHASQIVRRECAQVPCASSAASFFGVSPSHDSARIFAPGWRCGMIFSSARPCSVTSAQSCNAQPSRLAARLKAEGCGRQHDFRRRNDLRQQRADAEEEGIAGGQHRHGVAARAKNFRKRLLQRRGPRKLLGLRRPDQFQMARAADDESRLRDARACGSGRPSSPSSPSPTMVSQGDALMSKTSRKADHAHPCSRRLQRSEPARKGAVAARRRGRDAVARGAHKRRPPRCPCPRASAALAAWRV